MSDTLVQDGYTMPYTNATGSTITKDSIVEAGHCLGVANKDIANGDTGTLLMQKVHTAPKVSAAVFAAGEKLIWDTSAGAFDDSSATPAAGDITGAAVAWAAGANGETTCKVLLTPGNAALA